MWPSLFAEQNSHVRWDGGTIEGTFDIEKVLPGDYYLAAISSEAWLRLDEERLAILARSAIRVHVEPDAPVARRLVRQ